jgi:hypothetical protein
MPFVLIVMGAIFVVAAARGTHDALFYLIEKDFTGDNNFIYWFLSILVIGAVGYIPKLKPFSDGFLILVILVLFLKKDSGFFDMFQSQLGTTNNAAPDTNPAGTPSAVQDTSNPISGSDPAIGSSVTIGGITYKVTQPVQH